MHLRNEAEAVIAYGGNIVLCDNFVTCSIVMERVPMTLHKFLALNPNLKLSHKLAVISELINLLLFLKLKEFSHSDIKVRSIFTYFIIISVVSNCPGFG
jgi:heme/copper-type cytochrome/quinol oxidase subunit 4